jgi:curli biogenesis system outer membrane secretion channel CsgG
MRATLAIPVLILAATASLTGCTGGASATVVRSTPDAPTIDQARAAPADGPQHRIAVSAFEFRAGQGSKEIGDGMADMLTDSLTNTGRFIVLERERLNEVMAEQDLAGTGRFAKETVAPTGELEGAELLVRGSITTFDPKCAGGSAIIVSGNQACIAVNIRIIDARTGRVVSATTVEGTAVKTTVGLVTQGDMPFGLGAYRKTPMETAIRNCIQAAVDHVVKTKL